MSLAHLRRDENREPVLTDFKPTDLNDDIWFDRFYPQWAQRMSSLHWTPLAVIRRATFLLTQKSARGPARILDVGSGVGKFCFAGKIFAPEARFTGVEQRGHFVDLCEQMVRSHRFQQIQFIRGNLEDIDWSPYNGVYLFNPFQENKSPFQRLDNTVSLGLDLFHRYVSSTRSQLETLRPGSRVVTYHGYGGDLPGSFFRVYQGYCEHGPLECWEKQA